MISTRAQAQEPEASSGAVMYRLGIYDEAMWGVVRTRVHNPSATEQEVLVAHFFPGSPQTQFATRAWLPPRSTRSVITPVRPEQVTEQGLGIEIETRLFREVGDREFLTNEGEGSTHSGQLLRRRDEGRTGRLHSMLALTPREQAMTDALIDLTAAMNDSAGYRSSARPKGVDEAPRFGVGYDGVESIITDARAPRLDPLQQRALRAWLLAGGRLWICVDRGDDRIGRDLLPRGWGLTVVDQDELHQVTLTDDQGGTFTAQADEEPFRKAYVIADGFDVLAEADGWPAAMGKRVGRGRVLVTTVDPAAWITEDKSASEPLKRLGAWFLRSPEPATIQTIQPLLHEQMREQIGFEIIGLPIVASVLLTAGGALLLVGLWLHRRGELERIGWIGPVISLLAALALLAFDTLTAEQVPLTVVSQTVVEAYPEHGQLLADGLIGVHSPAPREDRVAAGPEVVLTATQDDVGNQAMRMVWDDDGLLTWERFSFPQDVTVRLRVREHIEEADLAPPVGRFTEQGVVVTAPRLRGRPLEDLLVVAPSAVLSPPRDEQALLTDRAVRAPGRYYRGMLSEEQQRRAALVRAVVTAPRGAGMRREARRAEETFALGWVDVFRYGVRLPDNARLIERTLVRLPVTLTPPEPGETITIPSAFTSIETVHRLDGRRSTSWNPLEGAFVEATGDEPFEVVFQLPREVGSLEPREARLWVSGQGAGWSLDLLGPGDADPLDLGEMEVRPRRDQRPIPVDRLRDLGGGRFALALKPSRRSEITASIWKLDGLGLTLTGRVSPEPLASHAGASPPRPIALNSAEPASP